MSHKLTNIISLITLLENELTGVTHASIDLQLQEALKQLAYLRMGLEKLQGGLVKGKYRMGDASSGGGATGGLADAYNAGSQGRRGMPERADQLTARSGGVVGGVEHPQINRRGEKQPDGDGIAEGDRAQGIVAAQHDTTLIECQQAAWEQIKSRKGKTVNGLFIKDGEQE
jgi:hypothetical protein